jgi:L-arabinose isomerase
MKAFENFEVWFITGAQLLYGGDAVKAVDSHSGEIVGKLNESGNLPVKIVYKGTVNSSGEVTAALKKANSDGRCIGVITWMHTFSPAKMWIHGLQEFRKPLLHLHTQFNKEIPWDTMDMDFMNLNQSAHGDREFGHITARMRKPRKIVVGHWSDRGTQDKLSVWMRVAAAWADSQDMLIIRLGDQMNNVAVTDGDKVDAEMRLGYHVDYCPIAELAALQETVSGEETDALMEEYERRYTFAPACKPGGVKRGQVEKAARIEIALRKLLKAKGAKAFTTNFDDLENIDQIPGLASQRLMAEGYGFGAEGDWKTAALCRTVWFMTQGMPGGCSFLEDYTLNFAEEKSSVLQAHMLEVCPLIAAEQQPVLDVFPLGIGGKNDPARLIFTSKTGTGIAATIVDMGNRFRMIANKVDCIRPEPLPRLPVASALWIPRPDFATGAGAWILAGGTHHTAFSYDLTTDYLEDYAEIAGIELLVIDEHTALSCFRKELRMNEVYYMLNKALQ